MGVHYRIQVNISPLLFADETFRNGMYAGEQNRNPKKRTPNGWGQLIPLQRECEIAHECRAKQVHDEACDD